jgi:putative thiamine transport system substrate-binding protein
MHRLVPCIIAFILQLSPAVSQETSPRLGDWADVLARARGQTVYWNAWAGEQAINRYIAWAAQEVSKRYGIKVEHVKLSDTSEAVAKIITEKAAGRDKGGSVDLIWINGPNFASLKEKGLLFGPWVDKLPNYRFADVIGKPVITRDFTLPTEGFESPWDIAQLLFYYDRSRTPAPPRTTEALLQYAKTHPGRITYPDVQNFLGATFLKQVLIELVEDRSVLQEPPLDADFARLTAPLWAFLDELHPVAWRSGKAFPANSAELRQLLADREIDIAFSFNPSEASLAIARGELPASVSSYVLDGGTIANANFLAIPYNASSKEGAMVVADFLLSPQAQARKQDPSVWGGLTVLSLSKLSSDDRRLFETPNTATVVRPVTEAESALPEPHARWMTRIIQAWLQRYASK